MATITKEDKTAVKVVGITPAGKEIGYRELGNNRFKEICFKDGGQIPAELGGMWVDPFAIEKEIKMYINKLEIAAKEQEEKKATKTKATKATKASK